MPINNFFLAFVKNLPTENFFLNPLAQSTCSGPVLTKFLAMVNAVNGVAPIIAPVLGGFLLNFMSWKGTFALNTVFTSIGCALSGKVGNEYKALKIAGTGMFGSCSA